MANSRFHLGHYGAKQKPKGDDDEPQDPEGGSGSHVVAAKPSGSSLGANRGQSEELIDQEVGTEPPKPARLTLERGSQGGRVHQMAGIDHECRAHCGRHCHTRAQQCDQCELGRPTKDEPRAGPPDERVHPGLGDGETDDQPERDRRYEQGQGVDHPLAGGRGQRTCQVGFSPRPP